MRKYYTSPCYTLYALLRWPLVSSNWRVTCYCTHKLHMWDHSVSMQNYVKHVLGYDNVSEQARKGLLCLWCNWRTDWRTQFSAGTFIPMSVQNINSSLIYQVRTEPRGQQNSNGPPLGLFFGICFEVAGPLLVVVVGWSRKVWLGRSHGLRK